MKIAIKKREKEVVKAKEKLEKSLIGLYKNKFMFTRRQLRALLGNISRERFSDELDHQDGEFPSPYMKRGDPADLLKKLTSKRHQLAQETAAQKHKQLHENSATTKRLSSGVQVKEFKPYTPEKKKLEVKSQKVPQ